MTNRLSYAIPWAKEGEVADPDLDTEHPLFLPDRYEDIGWQVEKPPEQWENFIYQNNDLKVIELAEQGLMLYADDITYKPGALTLADGNVFVNTSSKPITGVYPVATNETFALLGVDFVLGVSRLGRSGWSLVLTTSAEEFNSIIDGIRADYAAHLNADNPHKDTIEGIGGVSKTYVDDGFGSPTDPRTIVNHVNRRGGSVHMETPAQVGTLPNTGGHFTGPVTFLKKIIFDSSNDSRTRVVTSVGEVILEAAGHTLSLDSGGNAKYDNSIVLTKATFLQIQNRIQWLYELPAPMFSINVKSSLSDGTSVGEWTIESDLDVTNVNLGLKFDTNNITMTGGLPSTIVGTVYFSGSDGTSPVRVVKDGAVGNMADFSAWLKTVAPTATHVGYVTIYPTLNEKQKTKLVL